MDELSPANPSDMVIPKFDGQIDAYWWVFCTEKYFKHWGTPETLKMTVAGLAMKGPALTWWLRWYPLHPCVNWDAFTAIFLWRFKPEWRVILPLPDDEEDTKFEPQQWVQGDNVDEQSTMVEERIGDFNQHSSSLEFVDLEIANSIEDSLVQSQFPTKTPFNNEHTPMFFEPENQNGDNKIQPYELLTEDLDTVTVVSDEQKDMITTISKDRDVRLDFVVTNLVRNSGFKFATFAPVFAVPSMKATVNTTSATSPQHLVPLFDPGGYFIVQESWHTNQALPPPPKPPDRSFYSVSAFLYNNEFAKAMFDYSTIWTLFSGFASIDYVQVFAQKVFAEMPRQSVVSWLSFIQGFLINTYGWEVYTSLSLDLCKTYAFSDASKYCILSDYSQAWLQVTELICNELQQVLFLNQLGCNQSNHVKSLSSTKYTTVQIIQLIAIAVTGTFITIPLLLKFTSDMNLKYKEGLVNPLLTYDVDSYLFAQNLFTHVFSWCGFVRMVYKHFAISKACKLKWLLSEIERNNFSTKLVTLVLTNSACYKLKEVNGSEYIDRYITVGVVAPYLLVKNTLIDMVVACGGINTIGVFHIGLGMAIKPSVTLGRSTWAALNLFCNVIFNSIVVDDNECEKATWLKIGISSKLVVNIVFDLEDKITFREVGNDMINVVLIPCLFTNMLYNEGIICDIKLVEAEMMERIRHKILLSSWRDALEFYHVKIMDPLEVISMEPLEVDILNYKSFLTHYYDYFIGVGAWVVFLSLFNYWLLLPKIVSAVQQFLTSKYSIITDSNQMGKWHLDALCERKATLRIAQGLFQNVSIWDNLGDIFSIIKINDIWLGLYQIYMLQYREIHTNHAMMLTQAPWSSIYLVFAHVDQVGKGGDLNDDCINIKVLTEVGKTFLWTICDRFLILCAHFKQWDPGQHLGMSIAARSSKFKQWDPGKIYARSNFYNLEDKVDFEGVDNVMILEAQISVKPKIKCSGESSIF